MNNHGAMHVHGPTGALVTGSGNEVTIQLPCPGPDACPHKSESWQHEVHLMVEFAEKTSIWCPRDARHILGKLIGEFTPKELGIAWRANSIHWDAKGSQIKVFAPRIEAVFGWGLFALASFICSLICISLFLSKSNNVNIAVTATMAMVLYIGFCWFVGRSILWPHRIAIRVRNRLAQECHEANKRGVDGQVGDEINMGAL